MGAGTLLLFYLFLLVLLVTHFLSVTKEQLFMSSVSHAPDLVASVHTTR